MAHDTACEQAIEAKSAVARHRTGAGRKRPLAASTVFPSENKSLEAQAQSEEESDEMRSDTVPVARQSVVQPAELITPAGRTAARQTDEARPQNGEVGEPSATPLQQTGSSESSGRAANMAMRTEQMTATQQSILAAEPDDERTTELNELLAYMSLHSVVEGVGPSLTLSGKVGAHQVTILLDTGATGDFIQTATVNRLGYKVAPPRPN